MVKNTLLCLLCLPSACVNGAPDNAAPSPARVEGEVFRDALKDGGQGPEMVVLPAGSFRMGSPSGETGHRSYQGPVRTVNISKRIAMARYEVTFADIERYMEDMREAMFLSSEMAQDAVFRNIEIIGEASNNIRRAAQRYFPTSHVQDAQSCLAWL